MHTARRVMEDAGYRPPKVRREPHDERYEAIRPNHLCHLDFLHRDINRSVTFNLILIDDYSRYAVGHASKLAAILPTLVRTPGRSAKEEPPALPSDAAVEAMSAVLTYVMSHQAVSVAAPGDSSTAMTSDASWSVCAPRIMHSSSRCSRTLAASR